MTGWHDETDTMIIFKICEQDEWTAAQRDGRYRGSAHDRRDGFMHFSTGAQLPDTLAKHYAGRDGLVLIAFEAERFEGQLKWEPARDGDLFPHLYAELPASAALWTRPLPLGADSVHILPAEVAA